MVKHTNRVVALGTLGAMALTTFGAAFTTPAQAIGTNGKKNIAIGAAAVTGYGLIKKKRTVAIVGGVGTALAYRSYRKSKRSDEARRQAWYQQRYGRNWRNHYKPGA